MITVHLISPHNETAAVESLAAELRQRWPEVAASTTDRVDFLVGARVGVSVDLVIVVDLEEPRALEAGGRLLRCGMIAVELKQLCSQRFELRGNQLAAIYEKPEERTVVDQARDGAVAIKRFGGSIGHDGVFVYAVAWLKHVDEYELQGMDEAMVGRQSGIAGIIRAALLQGTVLTKLNPAAQVKVRASRDRLIERRTLSPLDRKKADRIARNAMLESVVRDLSEVAGKKLIRIAGHGGSGKTTALTLLASRLASGYGRRVLILSFHTALCTDIRSLLEAMPEMRPKLGDSVQVTSASSFLWSLLHAVGHTPFKEDGSMDYTKTKSALAAATAALGDGLSEDTFASGSPEQLESFAWDHVLIDEAQDWTDEERDFLCAVYGHRRLILMDGLAQLVRRQVACDWLRGVPDAEREVRYLESSLRMAYNVALFANAFAETVDLGDWRVEPSPALAGGRVVIVTGPIENHLPLLFAMAQATEPGHARPVDLLVCVPHSEVQKLGGGVRRSTVAAQLADVGLQSWDACDPIIRTMPPPGNEAWRIVQYDSCRGLEGYGALLIGLDDFYENRRKYPNQLEGDLQVDADLVARRFLLIPMTRAVALLIIHVRDVASPLLQLLREAAEIMPEGVVEWMTAADAPDRITLSSPQN